MPIEVPRGLPFAVDTWTPASSLKRHRFLTHAHRDHLAGIVTGAAAAPAASIYATRLTILITLHYFPHLDRAAFVELEVGAPPLRVPDPDGDFNVAAFDANHCPGAVMFLFQGGFGTLLHTGDCRLTPDCLQALPLLPHPSRRIDYVFLDCTFARCPLQFPTKEDSIRQVINCIWRHPNAPAVYLACDMLGQEDVLIEVSRTFGSKIHVDRDESPDCHHRLSHLAPEILADDDDGAATRFHVMAFPRLTERATELLALARARREPEPLVIRPSSQCYAFYEAPEAALHRRPVLTEPMRDEFGVWHVCLSMHSSREELEQALEILRPRWVVSTTPPCMAMDLSYVKKHCSLSRLGPDDPLWKLLGIADGMSTTVAGLPQQPSVVVTMEASEKSVVAAVVCSAEESASIDSSQIEAAEPSLEIGFEIRVEEPVTLFGSSRFGLLDDESQLWEDEYQSAAPAVVYDVKTAEAGVSKKDGMPDKIMELTDVTEVAANKQSLATEAQLQEHRISDCEDEVIDLIEDKKTLQISSRAPSELCKDDECVKVVEGTEEVELEARQKHDLSVESDLQTIYRFRMTEQGKLRSKMVEQNESMLQSSRAVSELCKDDKCVEVVKGTEGVELQARQRHDWSLKSDSRTICRSRVTEPDKVVDEVLAAGMTVSTRDKTEAAEDGTTSLQNGKKSDQDSETASESSTVVRSSMGLNANLRRLYRSMNVPVPRPLPSLVELMAASKRPRVSQTVEL